MAKIPSICLIPSGYKATKIYSVLPVDGNGDFTFDRGTSTAQTRVNKDGLIEDVDLDVPRLDYLDGGCPSLLLEPASTNLAFPSVVDAYSLSGTIVRTLNATLDPFGAVDGVKLEKGSASAEYMNLSGSGTTLSASTDYTHSVFVKRDTSDFTFRLEHNVPSDYGFSWNVEFTLTSNGVTINSEVNAVGEVVNYGNGWYRVSAKVTTASPSTTFNSYLLRLSASNGSGASFFLQHNQFEQKSYATSYIPTSGATALRAAETCNGAGTTAEINSQEGVLYAEIRAIADDSTNRVFGLSDGSANNRVIIYYNSSNILTAQVYSTTNILQGTLQLSLVDNLVYSKVAFHYKENDLKLYVNGLLADVDTSATMPTGLSELDFDNGAGSSPFYGRCKRLSVYDSALNDSQLETLTGFGSFSEMASYLSYS